MTEPLRKYRSSDVPEFSNYPAEPDRTSAEVIEFSAISEFDAMPHARASRYEEQARKIGHALGRLVNGINGIISPIPSLVRKQYQRAEDGVSLAKDATGHTYEDAAHKVRNIARQGVYEARARV